MDVVLPMVKQHHEETPEKKFVEFKNSKELLSEFDFTIKDQPKSFE